MIKCLRNGGNLMDNNELIVDNLSKEITELVIKSREKLKDEMLKSMSLSDDFDIQRTGVTEITQRKNKKGKAKQNMEKDY